MKDTDSRLRRLLMALTASACGLLFVLALAEAVLRFLPVGQYSLDPADINEANPILRFIRNGDFDFSVGPLLKLANRVHTNNDGFVNGQDYYPKAPGPLLAVVGDSYIQAQMLPWPATIQGVLAKRLAGAGRVYSFGASGSQLPQYLAYARYARDTYHPDMLAIVIVGNDFDESLWEYKRAPGFHYLERDSDGRPRLVLAPWSPTHATWLHAVGSRLGLRNLALVRYLRENVPQAEAGLTRLFGGTDSTFVGNSRAEASPERVRKSLIAIDDFLTLLPEMSGLEPKRVVLILDGMRPEIYSTASLTKAQSSYVAIMRRALLEKAQAAGFPILDMQPVFLGDFATNGQHFEWPGLDGHWNERGHALAAQEVAGTTVFKATFPSGQHPSP